MSGGTLKKKTKKASSLTLRLKRGDEYFFGDVSIIGNNIFSTNELLADFRRQRGETYNESIHLQDIQSIYEKYRNNGYIFSRITPIDNINEETKEVSYLIDIYEGGLGYISKTFTLRD